MNDYLESVKGLHGLDGGPLALNSYLHRQQLVTHFAFAIPDDHALDLIALAAPRILEVGAGTGYWAKLLTERGVDVLAVDDHSRNDLAHALWHPVVEASGYETVQQHADRALMLCWPEYDSPMAYDCLSVYAGNIVIYIGEGPGGCTGDDAFHQALNDGWTSMVTYRLPQWQGIHDELMIYRRITDKE